MPAPHPKWLMVGPRIFLQATDPPNTLLRVMHLGLRSCDLKSIALVFLLDRSLGQNRCMYGCRHGCVLPSSAPSSPVWHEMRCDRHTHEQLAQRRQRLNRTRALCHGHALLSSTQVYIDDTRHVAAGLIPCNIDVSYEVAPPRACPHSPTRARQGVFSSS